MVAGWNVNKLWRETTHLGSLQVVVKAYQGGGGGVRVDPRVT